MSTEISEVGPLSPEQVRSVLTASAAAPSLHNSQPWRFHCTPNAIELHADPDRALPATDGEYREMLLACGAALLNLRLAIRALGVHPAVQLFPVGDRPGLLAAVRPQGAIRPTPTDRTLAAAIARRRTNRRPFDPHPVPRSVINTLQVAARTEQAWLAPLNGAQLPILRALVRRAESAQRDDPAFRAEWDRWTGRDVNSVEGVQARSAGPLPEPQDRLTLRDFSAGTGAHRLTGKDFEPEPLIAAIGTFDDRGLAHLQAGQAMQRVLLTATAEGLTASFLSQITEVNATRGELRTLVGGGLWPQIVLRLGYGSPVPPTLRRSIENVTGAGKPTAHSVPAAE
jgi:nitroreductase